MTKRAKKAEAINCLCKRRSGTRRSAGVDCSCRVVRGTLRKRRMTDIPSKYVTIVFTGEIFKPKKQ